MEKEPNLAVLIDFENIATGTEREGWGRIKVRLIMDRFKEKGRILVARSYADWGRYAKFKQDMLMTGVNLFELTSHGMQDKNRADVALVVDCMELALTKDYVDTYVIVSGDSDFTPLVLKLKELNKRVIGCGVRKSTSRLIVESCDEFIFYDTLIRERGQQKPRTHTEGNLTRSAAFDLTVETLEGLLRETNQRLRPSVLKQAMQRKEPTFSEGDLGYSSFSRYLESCRSRGLIQLHPDQKGGGYLIDLPTPDSDSASSSSQGQGVRWMELEGESALLYEQLQSLGHDPLSPSIRLEVLKVLEAVVQSRLDRNLKCTARFIHQDVFKRSHALDPRLLNSHVKGLVATCRKAGLFVHMSDKAPVRTDTAGFVLPELTSEQMMDRLDEAYLKILAEQGVKLSSSLEAISKVLRGDSKAGRSLEEVCAWVELELSSGGGSKESAEEAPAPRRRRRSRKADGEKREPESAVVKDAAPEAAAAEAPAEEKKPARRRSRKAAAEDAAPEAAAEEKPKTTRRRSRKAAAEDAAPEAAAEEKPKTTRRRSRKAAAEDAD